MRRQKHQAGKTGKMYIAILQAQGPKGLELGKKKNQEKIGRDAATLESSSSGGNIEMTVKIICSRGLRKQEEQI